MPTDDQQILVTGQEDAPAVFTVPGNGQVEPKAVFATFDGTGAAGDFLPALKLLSDGGEVVGVWPTETAVVAGASADVSWFPGVKPQAASTAVGIHTCRVVFGNVQPSGTITNPTGGTVMPILAFATSDPASFTQVDANTISIPDRPLVVTGYAQQDGGAPVTTNGDAAIYAVKAGGIALNAFTPNGVKILQQYLAYTLTAQVERNGNWSAYACGSDTHFWDLTVIYYGVF